ncbi:assimilatory sulfite reductase (NADPH) flavoprotein subunit [Mariniphaga sediminis]|uniref:assimilatory sulfite reductase (NADPH) n=1 Tax=Mariniphaga sediminis TaxID=1628158 RepID=A0A399D3M7_9BACT|nr:assimilatory sulfite reductase (NADPH) flavoprotein subunit [Mariniphaga sediminis]RIH65262.1 assimilatory sulfite reductase (NADPH) flavoprotein subunit [Mariniphaga sediminis]
MNLKTIPFDESQLRDLTKQIEALTPEQILWLSGYLEGRFARVAQNGSSNGAAVVAQNGVPAEAPTKLTILYGTDTGRAKTLAENLLEKATALNISANVVSMYDYNPKKLKEEENLAVVVSTHGEGEPPDMAEDFHTFITGKRAPKLEKLKYSVLALGDKSYRHFCQTGADIDEAFTRLTASSITPIVKCDVDFEENAAAWMDNLLQNLKPATLSTAISQTLHSNNGQPKTEYSKKNPFMATVLEKVKITGRDSDKEVYHIELSLEGSGLTYEPGDAVGIFNKNPKSLVEQIIRKTGAAPEDPVSVKAGEFSLQEALLHYLEITLLSVDTIRKYYEKSKNQELEKLLIDDNLLDEYLWGNDVLDLLEDFPYDWNARDLVEILRPLPPRLYSISSSQETVDEEVHITVSVVKYEKKNRTRQGACSSFLAYDIKIDDQVPIYIDKNPAFKLPPNGAKIIMVGAGTGIAPYRAFMQERESKGLKGDSWLFFGDRHFYSDFLYQVEWQKLLKTKDLEKMDVAFSRDQQEKIYVQHKLKENQKEIFDWIENGAYLYLCGDRKNMAQDVNKALLEIIQEQGGVSEEQAGKYIKNLKREKRFQMDVY